MKNYDILSADKDSDIYFMKICVISFLLIFGNFVSSKGQNLSMGIELSSSLKYSQGYEPSTMLSPGMQCIVEKKWNSRINTSIGISMLNVGMFGTTICQAGPCPDQTILRYNLIEIPIMVRIGIPYDLEWRERIKLVLGYSFGLELKRTALLRYGDRIDALKIEDNKRGNHIINAGFEVNIIDSKDWYLSINLIARAVDYQYSTFDMDLYPYLGIRVSKRINSKGQ